MEGCRDSGGVVPKSENGIFTPLTVYHQKIIHVGVMGQIEESSVENDPDAVHRIVVPFGSGLNVQVTIEASTAPVVRFAEHKKYNVYYFQIKSALNNGVGN